MDSEPIQNGSIKQLKSKIKKFRNNFNNTHGRMPNQSDIKARPNILTLYSQLRSLVQPPKKKILKDTKSVTNNVMHIENSENNGISKAWNKYGTKLWFAHMCSDYVDTHSVQTGPR